LPPGQHPVLLAGTPSRPRACALPGLRVRVTAVCPLRQASPLTRPRPATCPFSQPRSNGTETLYQMRGTTIPYH